MSVMQLFGEHMERPVCREVGRVLREETGGAHMVQYGALAVLLQPVRPGGSVLTDTWA